MILEHYMTMELSFLYIISWFWNEHTLTYSICESLSLKVNYHFNRLALLWHISQLEVNISRLGTQCFCIAYILHLLVFFLNLKVNYLLEFQQIEACSSSQFEIMKCLCEHIHFLNISGYRTSKPNVADFSSDTIQTFRRTEKIPLEFWHLSALLFLL